MVHVKHTTRGAAKVAMRGEPRYRARKGIRRVQRKTPGGRTVVHYEKKNISKAVCAICKGYLQGLNIGTSAEMKKLSRTDRTVQRPFGAYLCSPCSREILSWRARVKHKLVKADDVPIHYRQFVMVK